MPKQIDEAHAEVGAEVGDELETKMREWIAIRKEAGLHIDPATAEVMWDYRQTLDPYGIDPELPEDMQQVGREYFARSPGNDLWVHFHDLPQSTRESLEEKRRSS